MKKAADSKHGRQSLFTASPEYIRRGCFGFIIFELYFVLTKIKLKIIFNIMKGVRAVSVETVPEWMVNLEEEDVVFIRRFLLASGSLKEVAHQYGVTYPTVRLRLDRLIQRIQMSESVEQEPYITLVKRLALNDKIDFDTAKLLITEYKKTKKREE